MVAASFLLDFLPTSDDFCLCTSSFEIQLTIDGRAPPQLLVSCLGFFRSLTLSLEISPKPALESNCSSCQHRSLVASLATAKTASDQALHSQTTGLYSAQLLPAAPPSKMTLYTDGCVVTTHRVANKYSAPMTNDAICSSVIFQASSMIPTPCRLDLHGAYSSRCDPSSVLFTIREMRAPATLDALNGNPLKILGPLNLRLATLCDDKVTVIGLLECSWSLLPQRKPSSCHSGKSTVRTAVR
mmetsp:Transcript_21563/g.52522  ORF Transcript_21563/g.52522 Transcript_21563/m.52522 type:complete len:242 (-) Transcript_21563:1310-2035(-)